MHKIYTLNVAIYKEFKFNFYNYTRGTCAHTSIYAVHIV